MAKRKSKLALQKGLVALIGVVSISVLGYFTFIVVDDQTNARFEEGTHFETIASPRRVRGDAIESTLATNVRFVKRPLVGSESWRILAQHFHTLESLDAEPELHQLTFSAIHNGRKTFESGEALASFIADNSDIEEADYLSHWNSPRVASELALSDRLSRQSQVASVPTLVVDGKYRVNVNQLVGPARLFDVADFLISQTQTESNPNSGV
jgi:hypothetical protein